MKEEEHRAAGPEATPTSADSKTPDGESEAPEEPPPPSSDPATEGFIQGLLEIHAQPPLEPALPGAEPPLLGVE